MSIATLAALDPIALRLGPLSVRWYGIIIMSAVVLAVWLGQREARRRGLDPEFMSELALWAVPIGFLGARLYEVFILQWPYYSQHPADILAIWKGGLAIHGGVIAGVAAGIVFTVRRGASVLEWGDIIAPGILLAQALGRWGNFFNQEAYGDPAPAWVMNLLPEFIREGMWIDGLYRHPTFLYESLWNLAGGLFLVYLQKRRRLPPGAVFFAYWIVYNAGRLVIESIRVDSSFTAGGLRVAQVMSVALILVGAVGLAWVTLRRSPAVSGPAEQSNQPDTDR